MKKNLMLVICLCFVFGSYLNAQIYSPNGDSGTFDPNPGSSGSVTKIDASIIDLAYDALNKKLYVVKSNNSVHYLNSNNDMYAMGGTPNANVVSGGVNVLVVTQNDHLGKYSYDNSDGAFWWDGGGYFIDLGATGNGTIFTTVNNGCIRKWDEGIGLFGKCLDFGLGYQKIAPKDNSTIWVIDANNDVFKLEDNGSAARDKMGLKAKDIAIDHYNNRIYAVDMNGVVKEYIVSDGGNWGTPSASWESVSNAPQNASRITAGYGKIWIVDDYGNLYEYVQPLGVQGR